MIRRTVLSVAAAAVALGALSSISSAQATATAGPQYEAGSFTRILLGDGWRDVWITPVKAPLLDPATHKGGLTFDKRGGGRQSITVHFKEADGPNGYVFRSVDKFPGHSLAPEFQGTLVGRIIQDQTSSYFPAAPLLAPPLLQAIGVLHLEPTLMVMADSKVNESVRDTVAGMLGTFELKPKEGKDDTPGFGGSRKIEDSEEFFATLREGHNNRLDEREFLASRLIDIMINDPDRTPDNYAWARFGDKDTGYVWRAIPRDRDWAFMDADGLINSFVVSAMWPKFVKFSEKPKITALTYATHQLDRKLLQRLTSRDFEDVAVKVQQSVTDQVIARSIAALPAEWRDTEASQKLTRIMRARRDSLLPTAMRFYRRLAQDVDLYGTDVADRVEITRHNDGRVTVTIAPATAPVMASVRREDGRVVTETGGEVAGARDVFYQRTFIAPETQEIRVYLGKGDDVAVVRGARNHTIGVRVIGEKGNDVFADSANGGGTHFYDDEGTNTVLTGPELNTKPYEALLPTAGLRLGVAWRPDWGGKRGWGMAVGHETGSGVVVGGGFRFTRYGFRRMPHEMKGRANLFVSPTTGRLGLVGNVDYRMENSPVALTLDAKATQLEGIRFYGYGNDTPDIGSSAALVEQRIIAVDPAYVYRIGWRARENGYNEIRGSKGSAEEGEDSTPPSGMRALVGKLSAGPSISWIDPEPVAGSPLLSSGATGANGYGMAGLKMRLDLDRTDDDAMPTRGFTMRAEAAGYPALMGLDAAFGTLSGRATAYMPIVKKGPHLAMRVGGGIGAGDVPVQFAPALGGRSSLRGFSSRRFTGDAAANAGVELRVPVGEVNLFMRAKLGVFALADAGRVWVDGVSDGGLHTGVGGGFWLATLGKSVSVAYAKGDGGRLYVRMGQSY